uniref:Uncharacterized protein n=1 Tax=Timema cristinae TaxID=61476 RepID=A0A7R9DQU2_TIMCR|nr:unnamed protein product [Timema cristinae]
MMIVYAKILKVEEGKNCQWPTLTPDLLGLWAIQAYSLLISWDSGLFRPQHSLLISWDSGLFSPTLTTDLLGLWAIQAPTLTPDLLGLWAIQAITHSSFSHCIQNDVFLFEGIMMIKLSLKFASGGCNRLCFENQPYCSNMLPYRPTLHNRPNSKVASLTVSAANSHYSKYCTENHQLVMPIPVFTYL